MKPPSARHTWQDAVFEDPDLKPLQKLVALAFAKYAGNGLQSVWVAWSELLRVTGLSNSAASRAIKSLRAAGWLVLVEAAAGPRAARYSLTVPHSATPERALANESTLSQSESTLSQSPQHYARESRTTRTTKNHNSADLVELAKVLRSQGVKDQDGVERVIAISLTKGTASPIARLLKDAGHRRECVAEYLADANRTRQRLLDAEPQCVECNRPESLCRAADAKAPAEDRHVFSSNTWHTEERTAS